MPSEDESTVRGDRVSGIKSNKSFDEIVKIISEDEGNTDLKY